MTPSLPPYLECNITRGQRAVIEAAAGTGKTYNITNIVARIILERADVSIDNMVIVTFTRAAAGELKTRISQRLAELEKALQSPGEVQDELLKMVKHVEKKELQKRVRLALLNFDRAMIGTIHSFAMRALSEYSFNSKQQFEFTLNEVTPAIIKELCNDFWRGFFYDETKQPLTVLGQETVEKYCTKRLANPELNIVWPAADLENPQEEFLKQAAQKAKREAEKKELKNRIELKTAELKKIEPLWKNAKTAKSDLNKAVKEAPAKSEARQKAQAAADEAKKAFENIDREYQLLKTDVENLKTDNKQLNRELEEISNNMDHCLPFAAKEICEQCFDCVKSRYELICKEKNFLGNDDLILKMGEALSNPDFVQQLQEQFPVGLIDEFQDTNDSQFVIFKKVFLDNPASTFLVVGDPRQAIYRFRNCDIQTYLEAKKLMLSKPHEAKLFNMDTNRRSGEKYIDALNAIFTTPEGAPGTFAMEDMTMPQQYAVPGSKVLLTPDGTEIAFPIECAVNADLSNKELYHKCADDIYNIISQKYLIPAEKEGDSPRPVTFGDIAVLTNSWNNAALLREAFQKRGIPVRLVHNPNVFKTPEAGELAILLEGILNFSNQNVLLRAIITSLCNFPLSAVKSEQKVEFCAQTFKELNTLWHKRSFLVMYNELLVKFDIAKRLSDRSLSNLNTIADILGEEAFSRKLPPFAVMNSLQKHIERAQHDEKDSFSGHPETDQGTVQIDTVFGSKGLSYPLVYLPDLFYVSDSFNSNRISKTFHNPEGKLCYAPFITNSETVIEYDEMIQDNLRKAYVAFTRAKYYCCFYYGSSSYPRCSAVDWLFRNHGITEYVGLKEKMENAAKTTPDLNRIPAIGWRDLETESSDAVFEEIEQSQLRRSDLMPELFSQSGFLSFSSITPHSGYQSSLGSDKEDENDGEEPQQGETPPPENEPPQKKEICSSLLLPAGTNFGNAIHKIMETCDYRSENLTECAAHSLRIHGMPGENVLNHTCDMLHKVLKTPIADADGGTFTLAEIDPARKKCELDFIYEFSQVFSTRHLFNFAKKYFENKFQCTCPQSTDISSSYDSGFFNGSIDLFFEYKGKYYIIDWKTNLLKSLDDYSAQDLPAAMAGSRYYVQYMIYTAALFKYLKQRLPAEATEEEFYNKYMGGVRYLFVRGVYNTDGHGIFSDRLPYEKYKELESIIG